MLLLPERGGNHQLGLKMGVIAEYHVRVEVAGDTDAGASLL